MQAESLKQLVEKILEDRKAQDVVCLEVRELTSIADYMIVATGTSSRQVKSMADEIAKQVKEQGHKVNGIEGDSQAEWVLIDLGDVIIHLMQAATRKLYDLESLWGIGVKRPE